MNLEHLIQINGFLFALMFIIGTLLASLGFNSLSNEVTNTVGVHQVQSSKPDFVGKNVAPFEEQ